MNCSVCGSPLLFDRVVFRCECGTYVHAYCADKHIINAHRPEMEEGYADLNGEFHLKHQPEPAPVAALQAVAAVSEGETVDGEDEEMSFEEDLVAEADITDVAEEVAATGESDDES